MRPLTHAGSDVMQALLPPVASSRLDHPPDVAIGLDRRPPTFNTEESWTASICRRVTAVDTDLQGDDGGKWRSPVGTPPVSGMPRGALCTDAKTAVDWVGGSVHAQPRQVRGSWCFGYAAGLSSTLYPSSSIPAFGFGGEGFGVLGAGVVVGAEVPVGAVVGK
jgi:hypothetical protein